MQEGVPGSIAPTLACPDEVAPKNIFMLDLDGVAFRCCALIANPSCQAIHQSPSAAAIAARTWLSDWVNFR